VASDTEAERSFSALADGGQLQMPRAKTSFSSRFGMVLDRFGMGGPCGALTTAVVFAKEMSCLP